MGQGSGTETRTFAAWVEPIARRDRDARAELIEFARRLPLGASDGPSPLDGWTSGDLLAHLADDTGKWFAHILQGIVDEKPIDVERVGPRANINAINAHDVEERRGRSVADLVAEVELDGRLHEDLLAQLTAGHENTRLPGYEVTLGDFLRDKPSGNRGQHDREHLSQLRAAQESGQ